MHSRARLARWLFALALWLGAGPAWADDKSMFDDGQASRAFTAIRDQIGHDPRVLSVTITPDELAVEVANDDKPGETDTWRLSRKGWLSGLGVALPSHDGSRRASLPGGGGIADYIEPIDAAGLADVPRIAAAALSYARFQSPGRVTEMEFRRLPKIIEPGARDPRWSVHAEAVEEEADISAKPTGEIVSADLNRTKRAQNLDLLAGGEDFDERIRDIAEQTGGKWAFHYIAIEKTDIDFDVHLKSVANARVTRFRASLNGVRTDNLSVPHFVFPGTPADDPFEFSDVDFKAMVRLEAAAKERLAIADGVVQRLTITRPHRENGGGIEWQVDVKSAHAPLFVMPGQPPVEEGSVVFDAKGDIVHTKYPPGRGPKINLFDPAALQVAIAKIGERLGAKVKVSELRISADTIAITTQDPKDPKRLAAYAYRDDDVAAAAEPLQQMANAMGPTPDWLWDIGQLTPAVVQSLAALEKRAMAKVGDGAAVDQIMISKDKTFHPENDKVLIEIYVGNGGADTQNPTFDLSGAELKLAVGFSGIRVGGGGSGAALATTAQDDEDCTHSTDPDVIIPACTKLAADVSDTARNRAVAYYDRGNAYKTRKDYDSAIADYSEALKLDPKYAHAFLNRGYCYAAKNDANNALADLTRAIELDPKEPFGYSNRAFVYRAQHNYEAAVADFSKVIALGDGNAATYYDRGLAYAGAKNWPMAIADYDAAIKRNAGVSEIWLARGDAHRATSRLDDAMADYGTAIKLAPAGAEAYSRRGVILQIRGDFDGAVAEFSKAIERSPKWAWAYGQRGAAYSQKGDFERAVAEYDQAIQIAPKEFYAYYRRGYAHYLEGAEPKALADLTQANALNPADAYSALLLDITGRKSQLPSRLAELSARIDMTVWPAPAIRLFLGQLTPEAVVAAADTPDPGAKRGYLCEANYYIGEWALRGGDKAEATRRFLAAATDCETTWSEWELANGALKALGVALPPHKP